MNIEKKEIYLDVLDSKQDFLIVDNDKRQRGYLYEFNFKSANVELSTEEIEKFLENFSNFTKVGRDGDGFQYTAHFTGITSENIHSSGFRYFKLIVGLSTKRTLTEVDENILKLHKNSSLSNKLVLLNKRIIKNRNDVTVEEYLNNLNQYLEDKFPRYVIKQVDFEGIEDRFQISHSSGLSNKEEN